jgi:hypothetical protein
MPWCEKVSLFNPGGIVVYVKFKFLVVVLLPVVIFTISLGCSSFRIAQSVGKCKQAAILTTACEKRANTLAMSEQFFILGSHKRRICAAASGQVIFCYLLWREGRREIIERGKLFLLVRDGGLFLKRGSNGILI